MKPCKRIRRWLPDALSGELNFDLKKEMDAHLATCADCRNEFETLNSALGRMDAYRRPDPETVDWDQYWTKLEARLPERKTSVVVRIWQKIRQGLSIDWSATSTPRLALGAAIVLVIGIFVGRTFFSKTGIPVHQPADNPLLIQTGQYLERSKLILLGIVNTDSQSGEASSENFATQKAISRELLDQSGTLKAALASSRQPMLSELVEELERVLIQIANMETESDVDGVELIRSGAEHNAILFKINIGELYLSRPESTTEKTDRKTT